METLLLVFDLVCASLEALIAIGGPIAVVVLFTVGMTGSLHE